MIRKRKSVRSFVGRVLKNEDREALDQFIRSDTNPFDVPVDFRLLEAKANGLSSPVIVGTDLYLAAKEAGAVMACYGHTHVAFYDESGDVRILCPGSISSPRDGTNGTYAIINTDDGHLECRLFEYGKGPLMIDAFGHAKTRPKKRGGFLRRTFNDSDGQ